MKFVAQILLALIPMIGFAAPNGLTEVALQTPRAVKNADIIKAANRAVFKAVYWEDEGKEFGMFGEVEDLAITKVFLDSQKAAQKLEMTGRARVGGYGWRPYAKGWAECTITIERLSSGWPDDGSTSEADCEITIDRGE